MKVDNVVFLVSGVVIWQPYFAGLFPITLVRIAALTHAVAAFALIIGFVAIYQWQQERRITELADMDFAVLLDDAPIGTYADKGFGTLLQTGTDEL